MQLKHSQSAAMNFNSNKSIFVRRAALLGAPAKPCLREMFRRKLGGVSL